MNDATSDTDVKRAMIQAAEAARFAPSIHNTQPWRWVVHSDRLELFAVTERQLQTQDPEGHMLLLSCGTAVHHAQVALTAEGWRYRVERPAGTPLAVIHPGERGPIDPVATRHFQMLEIRRTDRRTVSDETLAPDVLRQLVAATERAGSRLHVLRRDQVIELAVAVEQAQQAQDRDEGLQAETTTWIGGERSAGTGVPGSVIPDELPPTTVAERDFGAAGTLAAGGGHDTAATYAVLYGPDDEPVDWLRAGEALSALWLTATEHGASVLPVSNAVEVPFTRHAVRRLLGDLGYPYLAIRLGILDADHPGPAHTPRLPVDQVVEVAD